MAKGKVPAASKKYVSNEILLTPRSCESNDVAAQQSPRNASDLPAKDSKTTGSESSENGIITFDCSEVKANVQKKYIEEFKLARQEVLNHTYLLNKLTF